MKTPSDWQLPQYTLINFRQKRSTYCVVIPVINEGSVFLNELKEIAPFTSQIDVIVVDGGSNDGSTKPNILRALHVKTLITKKGGGALSSQLRLGYAYALISGYSGVITIDGNGKDKVSDIRKFIDALQRGYDYVQGSRFIPGGNAIHTPLVRLLAIRLIHAPIISWLSGFHFTDTTNGFRGYSKKLLTHHRVQPFRNIFSTYELLAYLSVQAPKIGLKTIEIPVTRRYPRDIVPTKINTRQMWNLVHILLRSARGLYNPS